MWRTGLRLLNVERPSDTLNNMFPNRWIDSFAQASQEPEYNPNALLF